MDKGRELSGIKCSSVEMGAEGEGGGSGYKLMYSYKNNPLITIFFRYYL